MKLTISNLVLLAVIVALAANQYRLAMVNSSVTVTVDTPNHWLSWAVPRDYFDDMPVWKRGEEGLPLELAEAISLSNQLSSELNRQTMGRSVGDWATVGLTVAPLDSLDRRPEPFGHYC